MREVGKTSTPHIVTLLLLELLVEEEFLMVVVDDDVYFDLEDDETCTSFACGCC